MTTAPTAAPTDFEFRYGDSVTTVPLPLPLKHRYTKGQQEMVKAVTALGWELDDRAVRLVSYNRFDTLPVERRLQSIEQHPFIFVRESADGGWWELELDYVSREFSYYRSRDNFNKALLGAKLKKFNAEADRVTFDDAISGYPTSYAKGTVVLQKQSTAGWANHNWVTAVASQGGRDTLRAQVLALATNPELVLWLAAESHYEAEEARRASRREAERVEQLKRQPLPAGWDGLKAAAKAVAAADGMSDTTALLAALKAAVAAVEGEVVVH